MKVPLILRIAALVVAATAFYTYVGQLVPQKEVYPPAEVEMSTNMSTDEMVKVGRQIMEGKGLCFTCHTVGKQGALRFPDLQGIGSRAATREPGLNDVQYLEKSLYEPDAFIVPGFNPGMPVINKAPIGLTDQEILAVIATLQSMGGTPNVTMETKLGHASGGGGAASGATVAGGTAAGGPPSGTEPQPTAAVAATTAPTAGAATPAVASADPLRDFGCIACHGLDGSPAGGKKGPSLAGIGGKMDANGIATALVRAHADTNQNLTLGQIRALARELAASKSGP
jgi:cytochrome c2